MDATTRTVQGEINMGILLSEIERRYDMRPSTAMKVMEINEIIDSIVVHELCHIKQMNHSARFYAEIDKVFPNYKQCHLWLKQNGAMYAMYIISSIPLIFTSVISMKFFSSGDFAAGIKL